jgi:CheY-like chemotaxis protein
MPIVLVVDDSPTDRFLVGKLLEKEGGLDWVLTYAESGEEALTLMEDVLPNLVVTDLILPGMDGLEFVETVRAKHPDVPVILITGQGSETLAIDALERGAASYVPKSQMAEKLPDTVRQVLAVARADRSYQRLAECIVENRLTLRLENDPALVASAVDHFQQFLARMHFCDVTDRVHLGIALEEALLNALYHGNLALTPEQACQARSDLNQGKPSRVVLERRAQLPYRDRHIHVEACITPEDARFVIRDEGDGFSRTAVPERHDPQTLGRRAGRGLVLLRNFMDEVTFNDAGNEVTLVKKCGRARVACG